VVDEGFNWSVWWEYFPNFFLSNIVTILFSYFILNHFYYLFSERKGLRYFIQPLFICIIGAEVYNLLIDYLLPLKANIGNPLPIEKQIISNLLVGVLYIIFIFLIAYITHLRDERKKHRQLKEQKLQLEVEKAQAELKFLKSQINPHFLHNTLNSFYARSLPLSSEIAENILTLSQMMRYAIDQPHTVDGKVALKDEIEHVKNLIKINQFRFRNKLNIELEVKGEVNGAVIIPIVLITIVENIFKHGDLNDSSYPIRIAIEIRDGRLKYCSQNKKNNGPKEFSTGIGLENIRRRLELTYGKSYTLIIKDKQELYTTELIIIDV
jgi:LytS/YehU family sensor histidine kinase